MRSINFLLTYSLTQLSYIVCFRAAVSAQRAVSVLFTLLAFCINEQMMMMMIMIIKLTVNEW